MEEFTALSCAVELRLDRTIQRLSFDVAHIVLHA